MERGQLEHSRGHVPGGNWATVEFDSPWSVSGGAFWELEVHFGGDRGAGIE